MMPRRVGLATGYNDLDAILEPPQGQFKLGIPAFWLLHPVRYCDDFDYPYDLLGDTLAAVTSRKTDGTETPIRVLTRRLLISKPTKC
jgi:hypothetical protein